jgi:LysR family transcriptional regulator, hca operon transcriptional activator
MGLRHLRYFVAVPQALSFTKGAEKLHLAQPSLTPQIRDLEEEIGVRLLDRSKGRVSLTPEGQSFLVDAKRVLDLSEEIVESVRHFSRHELAPLNIGYVANLFYDLLPVTLASFQRSFPTVPIVRLVIGKPRREVVWTPIALFRSRSPRCRPSCLHRCPATWNAGSDGSRPF